MIVAFSTSSPLASVALLSAAGEVIGSAAQEARTNASGACLTMMERLLGQSSVTLRDAELFLADLGPGSFTGVKVGVTLAKSLAFATGRSAGGASSFDLIAPHQVVVFPSRRGEWFVRRPGEEAIRTTELPEGDFVGFGPGIEPERHPLAERFADLLGQIQPGQPELLVPLYLIEPSISVPKRAFGVQ